MIELFINDNNLELSLRSQLKLSKILKEQNKIDESIYTLKQASKLYPNRAEPDCLLGLFYTDVKNQELAIASYRQALNKTQKQPAWVYSSLAKLLIQKGEIDEVVEVCQQACDLGLTNDELYRCFGIAAARKDNHQKMFDCYEKAIDLNPNQPAWLYLATGQSIALQNCLFDSLSDAELEAKRERLDRAIHCYQKNLELKGDISFRFYYELARLLLKAGKYRESLFYYFSSIEMTEEIFGQYPELDKALCQVYGTDLDSLSRAIEEYEGRVNKKANFAEKIKNYHRFGFLGTKGAGIDRPANYYFINPKLKGVYCSIPKNACTLFKTMMLEQTPIKEDFLNSKSNIHVYLDNNQGVLFNNFEECIDSSEYFKFTILRNPLERLVSAYLDKFAKYPYQDIEGFCQNLVQTIYRRSGIKLAPENSITFSQFVRYIIDTDDRDLNDHWKPQSSFIGSIEFDFIGRFEDLNHTIDVLQNRFNIKITKKVAQSSHITQYQEFDRNLEFHNMYPTELRQLAGMPKAQQLYTPELLDLVRSKYAKDIEIYEKTFQVKI